MLKMSALKLLKVANVCYQHLIIPNYLFYSPTDAAPQLSQELILLLLKG